MLGLWYEDISFGLCVCLILFLFCKQFLHFPVSRSVSRDHFKGDVLICKLLQLPLQLCPGFVDRTASCLYREERLVLSQVFPHLVIIRLLVFKDLTGWSLDFHGPQARFNIHSFMVTNSVYYFIFIDKLVSCYWSGTG